VLEMRCYIFKAARITFFHISSETQQPVVCRSAGAAPAPWPNSNTAVHICICMLQQLLQPMQCEYCLRPSGPESIKAFL
jgi:hypothetical protein